MSLVPFFESSLHFSPLCSTDKTPVRVFWIGIGCRWRNERGNMSCGASGCLDMNRASERHISLTNLNATPSSTTWINLSLFCWTNVIGRLSQSWKSGNFQYLFRNPFFFHGVLRCVPFFWFNQVSLRDISLLCCKVLGQRQKHRPGSQGRGQVEGSTLKMAGWKITWFSTGKYIFKMYHFPIAM